MTQNKLVGFCYAFIVGIALAMAWPLGADAVAPMWALTGILLAATAAGLVLLKKYRKPEPGEEERLYGVKAEFDPLQAGVWALLLVAAFAFGYTRYLAMIQSPDRVLGKAGAAGWAESRPMGTTSFVRLKMKAPQDHDVTVRLKGSLSALMPNRDEAGDPILNADGKWTFSQTDVPQECEAVLEAGETELLVQQPFTAIESVEAEGGEVTVLEPVNTVSLFARQGRNVVPVNVLGRITADPWVYSFKTVLSVTPDYIQWQPDGPYFKVARQTIRVTVNPEMPGYAELARSAAYGYDVAFGGELIAPSGSATLGSFDQAKYLKNYNIGGQMTVRTPTEPGEVPFRVIKPQGAAWPREGNGLVEFSLYLRDEIVRVIKQTMPQPNSAFLGALTLGLRYGMQNTVSIASDVYDSGVVAPIMDFGSDTDALIADEFRASGINHVLAVSGLHVTIITVMFMGIFTLVKISKKVYVPFVVFALVIFAIITGARPSTLRAVIMNSLFLLTWGYMGQGVRSSALLGVPVAAFIILVQNPAMTVDPSFTLSFGAILSLALLTQPFFDIFKKAQGNDFIALCIAAAVLTYVFAAQWLLTVTLRFWVLYALLVAALFWGARRLTKKGIKPIGNFGFADIPVAVSGFIAAQFGMQVGMMIPLSAYYFYRWPVAGAYANLIAIPLVGVVLQLSMLAGLIGLIPGVGIYIALFLNAANWIFSTAFLLIGHYFSSWFVYPFVTKPTLAWIFTYYACCALFIWWRPLWYRWAKPWWRRASKSGRLFAAAGAVLLVGCVAGGLGWQKQEMRPAGELQVGVLSVGYGSGIFVSAPNGKAILIDTAFVQTDRGRRNDAERTIMPYVCSKQVKRLDALILTSPRPEHTAGAPTILRYLDVDELIYPESVGGVLAANGGIADVLEDRAEGTWANELAGTTIPKRAVAAGERLFEDTVDGKEFRIEVLGPMPGDANGAMTLRIVYGDFALLVAGDLTFPEQQALLDRTGPGDLKATVVVAPGHGTPGMENVTVGMPKNYEANLAGITGELLKRTGAETVIFEFGNPRPVLGEKYKVGVKLHGAAKRAAEDALPEAEILATDIAGSVTIASDGREWSCTGKYAEAAGLTDAPTSLEVGW